MPAPPVGRRRVHPVALVLLVAALAGCNAATGSPSARPSTNPSSGPDATASPTPAATQGPTVGAIDHATGPTDIVLRLETTGGFAPMEFLASSAPTFTLFGNGIVVFQPKATTAPQPDAAGVIHNVPWRAARLDERQVQDLLAFALGPGGLGTARDAYIEGGIADAPNTVFTIKAGGLDKTVVVNALSEGGPESPDSAARAAFQRLAERLRDFDQGGSISTDVYDPDAFRGVLMTRDPDPAVTAATWPWTSIRPADFKEGVSDGSSSVVLPHRTLTAAEAGQLGLSDTNGGIQNLVLTGPDGKTYSLTLRPLLPGETE